MRRVRRTRREAFTLLEVMLVLGLLAMLALFVVPRFVGTRQKAMIRQAQAMVGPNGPVATALGLFANDFGRFPEELGDLVSRPDYIDEEADFSAYMETTEFKDPWGSELVYKYPGDVQEDGYDLISMGPDKEEDTDDDITNFRQEK